MRSQLSSSDIRCRTFVLSCLLAVLLTDIVDSTRHAARLGDAQWSELLRAWERAAHDTVQHHGGRWVKSLGDGGLATFASPAQALQCSVGLGDVSSAFGLQLRTGIHAGQVKQRGDGDIDGIAVHVAARVTALAAPGEVLTSSTVRDLMLGSELRFIERGEYELKGVPDMWRLYALDISTAASAE